MLRCRHTIDLAIGGADIGNADGNEQQRHQRAHRAGHDQGTIASGHRNQPRHDGGCDGAAEEAGKGVDRKCAAHARLIHVGRKDRIIGRMIDAVGKPQQHGACDQPSITEMQAEHDQREAAEREAHQQDFAGADMVGKIAHWCLGQGGYDGEHGQRKAKLDVADAELFFEKREQHRRHHEMEMADPMGRRNPSQRAQRGVGLGLLRCGHNVDHLGTDPVQM